MNKKIIILIVAVLVIAGIAGAFVLMNSKDDNSNNDANNQTQNSSNTNTPTDNDNNSSNDNNENGDDNVNNTGTGKTLVLYFSMSGNTKTVAEFIHEKSGGDLVELETVKTYSSSYNDLLDEAQEEQRKNTRPELKTKLNLDDYDTIFLGYPIWWGDMPMPIYTLLDNYDFSGKTIAPFITHGGSGLSGTPAKIKKEEPNATVTEGLAISGSSANSSKASVNNWLSKIGY